MPLNQPSVFNADFRNVLAYEIIIIHAFRFMSDWPMNLINTWKQNSDYKLEKYLINCWNIIWNFHFPHGSFGCTFELFRYVTVSYNTLKGLTKKPRRVEAFILFPIFMSLYAAHTLLL